MLSTKRVNHSDNNRAIKLAHMTQTTDPRFGTLVKVFTEVIAGNLPLESVASEVGKTAVRSSENPLRALDVGAYAGVITRAIENGLHDRGIKIDIIGLDPLYGSMQGLPTQALTPASGQTGREKAYVCGKGEKIPFADNTMNVVFAIDSIHHSEYPFDVIREMWRVLADNGLMIIKDHDPDNFFRFIQSAISDIFGNTKGIGGQFKQTFAILKTALKHSSRPFRSQYNKPYQPPVTPKNIILQGSNAGDTQLPFNFIHPKQWKQIFEELEINAKRHPFKYDFLPFGLAVLDQNECLWVAKKTL